jgi:hypothetical protein
MALTAKSKTFHSSSFDHITFADRFPLGLRFQSGGPIALSRSPETAHRYLKEIPAGSRAKKVAF